MIQYGVQRPISQNPFMVNLLPPTGQSGFPMLNPGQMPVNIQNPVPLRVAPVENSEEEEEEEKEKEKK